MKAALVKVLDLDIKFNNFLLLIFLLVINVLIRREIKRKRLYIIVLSNSVILTI